MDLLFFINFVNHLNDLTRTDTARKPLHHGETVKAKVPLEVLLVVNLWNWRTPLEDTFGQLIPGLQLSKRVNKRNNSF